MPTTSEVDDDDGVDEDDDDHDDDDGDGDDGDDDVGDDGDVDSALTLACIASDSSRVGSLDVKPPLNTRSDE